MLIIVSVTCKGLSETHAINSNYPKASFKYPITGHPRSDVPVTFIDEANVLRTALCPFMCARAAGDGRERRFRTVTPLEEVVGWRNLAFLAALATAKRLSVVVYGLWERFNSWVNLIGYNGLWCVQNGGSHKMATSVIYASN